MESPDCTPAALLDVLLDTAQTADMRQHLLTISRAAQRLGRLPVVSSASGWRQLWRSKEWRDVVTVNNWLTRAGYATEGRRAVAVALWALVCNWEAPEQAVEVAASLGGSAGATATLTGGVLGIEQHGTYFLYRTSQCMKRSIPGPSIYVMHSFPNTRRTCTTCSLPPKTAMDGVLPTSDVTAAVPAADGQCRQVRPHMY